MRRRNNKPFKITIEERILDTEVDHDKLMDLVADTIIDHIAREIRQKQTPPNK